MSAPEPVAATKVAYSRTYKGKLVASRIPDEDLARIDELAAAQGITLGHRTAGGARRSHG